MISIRREMSREGVMLHQRGKPPACMPQDAHLSQWNNAMPRDFHEIPPQWLCGLAKRPDARSRSLRSHVVDMSMPMPAMRFCRHSISRGTALILLCGAHRSHREFEALGLSDVGCGRRRRDDDGKGANSEQA